MGVLWVVLLFDVEQGQVEELKQAEQTCTSHRIYMRNNNYYISQNFALPNILVGCYK